MSSLELFPISQLIHLKLQHTVAKPAEHSDDKRGDSEDPPSAPLASLAAAVDAALQRLPLAVRPPVENLGSAAITVPDRFLSQHHLCSGFW